MNSLKLFITNINTYFAGRDFAAFVVPDLASGSIETLFLSCHTRFEKF
jgi:hypothetical protein